MRKASIAVVPLIAVLCAALASCAAARPVPDAAVTAMPAAQPFVAPGVDATPRADCEAAHTFTVDFRGADHDPITAIERVASGFDKWDPPELTADDTSSADAAITLRGALETIERDGLPQVPQGETMRIWSFTSEGGFLGGVEVGTDIKYGTYAVIGVHVSNQGGEPCITS